MLRCFPSSRLWTRRRWIESMLCTAPALGAENPFPSERKVYTDPATEYDIQLLTDPGFASLLPPTCNILFPGTGAYLLYASERTGSRQAFALSLRNWQSVRLTDASALDLSTLTLTPDARNICYVDGDTLFLSPSSVRAPREIYRLKEASTPGQGMNVTPDGPSALVVENRTRLTRVHLARRTATTIVEAKGPIWEPAPRPRRASVLYRGERGSLWLSHLDGSRHIALRTAEGDTGMARWAPDGRTIFYLNIPAERGKPHMLRELNPDTGEDLPVAPTTQFVSFSVNRNGSVFVGASGSLASPYVLLLLRQSRRELTLCEHKASQPLAVGPVFSPDSQRVFFQSDRHGKPALCAIQIEKLVERTGQDGA